MATATEVLVARAEVPTQIAVMLLAIGCGHQHADVPSLDLVSREPEEALSGCAEGLDEPPLVDHHHRIGTVARMDRRCASRLFNSSTARRKRASLSRSAAWLFASSSLAVRSWLMTRCCSFVRLFAFGSFTLEPNNLGHIFDAMDDPFHLADAPAHYRRFPEGVRKAPNWRGSVRRFVLRDRIVTVGRWFLRIFLWPRNPVSQRGSGFVNLRRSCANRFSRFLVLLDALCRPLKA